MALQASSTDFYMRLIEEDVDAPSTYSTVAILEPTDPLSEWPFLVHSPAAYNKYGNLSAFTIDTSTTESLAFLAVLLYNGSYREDLRLTVGAPVAEVKIPNELLYGQAGPGWSEFRLQLPELLASPGGGGRTVVAVQRCCAPVSGRGSVRAAVSGKCGCPAAATGTASFRVTLLNILGTGSLGPSTGAEDPCVEGVR